MVTYSLYEAKARFSEVIRLVRQLLAKDPLRRPQTPDESIDRLTRLEIATFSQRSLA